jgi:aminoglycoside phosphotransferase (APT) family kinase protein
MYARDVSAAFIPAVDGSSVPSSAGGGGAGSWAGAAGELLARLHSAPPGMASNLAPRELSDEAEAVSRAAEHIFVLAPPLGERIRSLLHRVVDEAPVPEPGAAVLLHGDFKTDHLFVSPGRLTLIDFDSCCRGDPAADVGKMLADIQWRCSLGGESLYRDARKRFLEAYASNASGDCLGRAGYWESVLLAKVAARRVSVLDRCWEGCVEALVSRAEAVLRDS